MCESKGVCLCLCSCKLAKGGGAMGVAHCKKVHNLIHTLAQDLVERLVRSQRSAD